MDENKDEQVTTPTPEEQSANVPPPVETMSSVPEGEEAAPVPNPEKERDERTAPVAQGLIEDLAGIDKTPDVNDRSEFTNVIVSTLKRSLQADLNVATDNSYVFQLALGAFGAFNQFVMSCKMSEMQDVRFSKIAHEMMQLFAQAKVPMAMGVKTEDQVAALESVRPQMEEIFTREMLTKLEITYVLEGLLNAFRVTQQVYQQNVEDSVKRMEAKVLQIPDITDLTMSKLDWALQTGIDEILAEKKSDTVEKQS